RAWAMAAVSDAAETAAIKYHTKAEEAMAGYGEQGWLHDKFAERKNDRLMGKAEAARAEAAKMADRGAAAYDKLVGSRTSDIIDDLSEGDDVRQNRLVKRSTGEYADKTDRAVELGIIALTHMNTSNRTWRTEGISVADKPEIGASRTERVKTRALRIGGLTLRGLGIGRGRKAGTEFSHQLDTALEAHDNAERTAKAVAAYYDKMKVTPIVSTEVINKDPTKAHLMELAGRAKHARAQEAFNEGMRLAAEQGQGGYFTQKRTARKMARQQKIRDNAVEKAQRKATRQAIRYDRHTAFQTRRPPARSDYSKAA
ncbi:MAG TPA: hypothetical protein VFL85_03445, partial [Candidatus Saccharimonadales bacterium]|nr:hypothetical protein [Candidatus Saccharimonadales bacterium]